MATGLEYGGLVFRFNEILKGLSFDAAKAGPKHHCTPGAAALPVHADQRELDRH
jgi:hypothetical protein